jgi:HSP20 family protein
MRNLVFYNQRNPFQIFREMDEVFESARPDFQEYDQNFLLSVDIPGIKKSDLKIEIHGHQIQITGETKKDRMSRSFRRSFALPESVDTSKIEAHFEDGVLEVLLPKVESEKPRTIEIQSGPTGFFDKLLGSQKSTDVKVN